MSDEELLNELRRIRELIELMAEPDIAKRDAALRGKLREIVGSSLKLQQSVLLMDGSRAQKDIVAETSIHKGQLSTAVGKLDNADLLVDGKKLPQLVISIPTNFFESNE